MITFNTKLYKYILKVFLEIFHFLPLSFIAGHKKVTRANHITVGYYFIHTVTQLSD